MIHKIFNVGDLKKALADLPNTYDVCIQVNIDGCATNPNIAYHVVSVEHWDNPKNEYGSVYIRNFTEEELQYYNKS